MATTRTETTGRALDRRADAQRGFTLFEIMIVVSIIALVASFAIPVTADARRVANETAAIAVVRAIYDAQQQYNRKAGTPAKPWAASLDDLAEKDLLPAGLVKVSGTTYSRGGYEFITGSPSSDPLSMRVQAEPMAITTGTFAYLVLDDGTIYRRKGNPATIFGDPAQGEPIGK